MPIIKWEPLSELDRVFDDKFFPSISFPAVSSRLGWDMAVDLYEEKGNVIAKMTLPGIKPDDLDISVKEDTLRIAGTREEEKEVKEKDYYSKEIRRGSFSRVVTLPKAVNAAKTSAEYKDGVLQVTMPSTGGKKETSVKVKVKK